MLKFIKQDNQSYSLYNSTALYNRLQNKIYVKNNKAIQVTGREGVCFKWGTHIIYI
jgi:hypothetical protein